MSGALLLDCDGVLSDTELDGHLAAFNLAFAELGYGFRWSREVYAELLRVGGGKERLRRYFADHPEVAFAGGADLDAAVLALHRRKSEIYVEIAESGRLPGRPGVKRLVEEALDAGWTVAVASTSAPESVEAVLRTVVGSETRARMAGVFAGDAVEAKKPAPDIYLLALCELGLDPAQTVVIEDSDVGAAAAAAAGLAHLVTVSSFTTEEVFPEASAVVTDLGEPGAPARLLRGGIALEDGLVTLSGLAALRGSPV